MRRDLFDADESLAAIKPDGSLTQTAKDILRACDPPATEEEIARAIVRHFSQVQPLVRECIHQDLLKERDGRLVLTDLGREKLFL